MLQHKGTQELHTKRLLLRKYQLSDSQNMFKNYANDTRVTKFLNWKPYQKSAGTIPFLQSVIDQYADKNIYHWAIEYQGEIIGSISTTLVNDKCERCEVGYCIGHDYWNQGITTEALGAVISFLFNDVGMHRIMARHDIENPASGEVMKKCGMTCEGRLKDYYLHNNDKYSDCLIYGIISREKCRS